MPEHLHVSIPKYLHRRLMKKMDADNKSEWVSEILLLGIEVKEQENLNNLKPTETLPLYLNLARKPNIDIYEQNNNTATASQ